MWNKLNKVNALVMCENYVSGQTMKEMYSVNLKCC